MHVCICTRTDVFVSMLECNVKSSPGGTAASSVRLLVRCTRSGSRSQRALKSLTPSQQNSHLDLQWLYLRSGGYPPLVSKIIILMGLSIEVSCRSLVFLRLIG